MEYFPRKIEKNLEPWLKRKEVIVIKGPRQTGKTTLLLHLRERFSGIYVTLEDEEIKNALEKDPKVFVKKFGKKKFLFIDEAQYLKNIGKILKLLFDLFSEKLKLVVSGSGSFDIKVEVSKYLVGRAVFFELFPLDFEEFLLWRKKDLYEIFLDYKKNFLDFILKGKKIKVEPVFKKEFQRAFQEYILYGGFPAIVKEKNEEIKKKLLKDLVRTYLERDVFFFLGVRHLEKFRNFLRYLAFNSGNILNVSSLASDLKMDFRTAEDYLNILEQTYIISQLPPFYKNLATELKKAKKVYLLDTGLRNTIMDNFLELEKRTDKGQILENYVFLELKKNFEKIKYWRTSGGAEIDFILEIEKEILPIEVKSEGKITKGFLSFLKRYHPKRAVIFTQKDFSFRKINKTQIAFLPHFLF